MDDQRGEGMRFPMAVVFPDGSPYMSDMLVNEIFEDNPKVIL